MEKPYTHNTSIRRVLKFYTHSSVKSKMAIQFGYNVILIITDLSDVSFGNVVSDRTMCEQTLLFRWL